MIINTSNVSQRKSRRSLPVGHSNTRTRSRRSVGVAEIIGIGLLAGASIAAWGALTPVRAQNSPQISQNAQGAQNPQNAPKQAKPQTPQVPATATADPTHVAQLLDQTIAWYRQVSAQRQLVTTANDAVFADSGQQAADEVVRLVFEFARSEANAAPVTSAAAETGGAAPSPAQTLLQQEAKFEQRAQDVQGEVDALKPKVASATGSRRQALEAQLQETQAEVDLARARVDAIRNVAQFVSTEAKGSGGLGAQIDALSSTLPANLTAAPGSAAKTASAGQTSTAIVAASDTPPKRGLLAAAENVFNTWGKLRTIDSSARSTTALARSTQETRAPMTSQLRALSGQGDQLAQQADTATTAMLGQEKQQLDSLTQQFKQLASASAPIAKMAILLGLYQSNLATWRADVKSELLSQLRSLLLKLLATLILLVVILGASELARRAVQRYVRDIRLRSQLHWMRKLVAWFAIGLLVVFSLVTQIGSVATFAGLLSAGVALALQNVLQSMVGYFFLIGKHGIRAGDHVQIGGVTGEVIDVGLVRIHIMEMGGLAEDAPTGRVVAFSNSIVFQPGVGLFKQIPGTNFSWHEITLTLPADTNFSSAREQLMKAVEAGLADFKDEIARQHSVMEDTFEAAGSGLKPTVQLQFSATGLEAVVRYPVALRHATEIDDRVAHEVLNGLDLTHGSASTLKLKTSSSPA